MDILFAGNTNFFSPEFYEEFAVEDRCAVIGNAKPRKQTNRKGIRFFPETKDAETERIFQSYDFETVLFLSRTLDCKKKVFDELENLEYILYQCRKRNVPEFIYITQNRHVNEIKDGEVSRKILLEACDKLCRHAAEKDHIRVLVLCVPYLYGAMGEKCASQDRRVLEKWIQETVTEKRLELQGKRDTEIDFLHTDDLKELLKRILDDPWKEPYFSVSVGGKNNCTMGEVEDFLKAAEPQLTVHYSGKTEYVPAAGENRWARREYGFIPKADVWQDAARQLELEKKQHEKSAGKRNQWTGRWLRTGIEQAALFAGAEFLNAVTQNNVLVNFLDFRFIYIAIMACVNGLGAGVVAALLASAGYIVSKAGAVNWQVLFFNVENWLPFASYLLLGCVIGYTTDRSEDELQNSREEYQILDETYSFLHGRYMEVLEGKERFNSQIIGYRDSFGRMYAVVKKLNTTLPEQVFYEAVDVLEEILDNPYVAIYNIRPNSVYARLNVCSKRCMGNVKKSLKMTDYPKLSECLSANETFVNIDALEDYPAYATPVFRNDVLVGMILLMQADYQQMNMEFSNKFRIMTDMIRDSLIRAMDFYEQNENAVKNTRILENDRFEEILKVKQAMRKKQYLNYRMLHIFLDGAGLEAINEKLSGLVRENDVLGLGGDGGLYLLLSQTNETDLKIVETRLKTNHIRYKEVME